MDTVDKAAAWDEIAKKNAEIEQLRERVTDLGGHLAIALREWKLYSEMAEGNDGFDLATDKSAEGDLYRAAMSSAYEQSQPQESKT